MLKPLGDRVIIEVVEKEEKPSQRGDGVAMLRRDAVEYEEGFLYCGNESDPRIGYGDDIE